MHNVGMINYKKVVRDLYCTQGGQICENERMNLYWICKGRMDSRMLITKVLIACSGVQDLQVLRIEELNNGRWRKRYCSNT